MTTSSCACFVLGVLMITFLSACSSGPGAAQADSAKLAAIPQAMRPFIESNEIAGAVTLVATRDKVVHLSSIGRADIAANKPMRDDNLFWIASMTKPVTGVAVLMLQEEGKLSINDPVAKYIPEFASVKTQDGQPANLTLKHLLTHTSGLTEASPEQSRAARTLSDLIPAYVSRPVAFQPGSQWRYCQSGINSLARIVEIVSGQSFSDFLDNRLFRPLGMKDTTFYPTKEQLSRLAKSYKLTNGKLEEAMIFFLEGRDITDRNRYPAAHAGLFTTACDYARFCRMLLNDGQLDGKRYLKPESVKLMTTVHTDDLKVGFTDGNGWGLGCCVIRNPQGNTAMLSPGTFGHGGAYGTQAWTDPVKGVAYILMVQRANFPNADASDVRKVFQQAAAGAFAP